MDQLQYTFVSVSAMGNAYVHLELLQYTFVSVSAMGNAYI